MQYYNTGAARLRGRHIIYSFVPGPIGCEFGGCIDGDGGSKSFGLARREWDGERKISYHYKTHIPLMHRRS